MRILSIPFVAATVGAVDTKKKPLNILMLAMDDLRPVGSFFGEPEVKVPNIDKLSSQSTIFTSAYCQAPTCGVSRTSLLTGRRPDTNYVVTQNGKCPFTTADSHKDWQSLPKYFKNAGFTTAGIGKIWHPNVCEGAAVGEEAASWSLPYYHAPCISLGSIYNGTCYEDFPGPVPCDEPCEKVTSIYANATASDDDMPDGMIAKHAVSTLQQLAGASEPFFLAVGFHKPHLPHIAPQKYFDMYPLENVSLPASPIHPATAPDFAWHNPSEFQSYPDAKEMCEAAGFDRDTPLADNDVRKQRQAYFAAASYADAQVGRVLDELDALGLSDNTVVMLWGDHGWQLGEHNEWAKHTAFTRANLAPLLFSVPGAAPQVREDFAEFVDVYPTLADLAGIEVPPRCDSEEMSQTASACHEGMSLKQLVLTEEAVGKSAAFGQWDLGGHMGYSMYTRLEDGSEVRFTEWVGYDRKKHTPLWDNLAGRELYNRTRDPEETESVHEREDMASVVKLLSSKLRRGWRAAAPTPHDEYVLTV